MASIWNISDIREMWQVRLLGVIPAANESRHTAHICRPSECLCANVYQISANIWTWQPLALYVWKPWLSWQIQISDGAVTQHHLVAALGSFRGSTPNEFYNTTVRWVQCKRTLAALHVCNTDYDCIFSYWAAKPWRIACVVGACTLLCVC